MKTIFKVCKGKFGEGYTNAYLHETLGGAIIRLNQLSDNLRAKGYTFEYSDDAISDGGHRYSSYKDSRGNRIILCILQEPLYE